MEETAFLRGAVIFRSHAPFGRPGNAARSAARLGRAFCPRFLPRFGVQHYVTLLHTLKHRQCRWIGHFLGFSGAKSDT